MKAAVVVAVVDMAAAEADIQMIAAVAADMTVVRLMVAVAVAAALLRPPIWMTKSRSDQRTLF
jgi:hypothetical protein